MWSEPWSHVDPGPERVLTATSWFQLVPVGSSWTSTSRRSAGGLRVVPACSSVAQTQAVPLIASNYRFASVSVATDHNPSEDVQGVFLLVFLVLARTRRAAVEGRRSSITSAAAPDGAQVLFVSPETPPLQRRDKRVQPPPPRRGRQPACRYRDVQLVLSDVHRLVSTPDPNGRRRSSGDVTAARRRRSPGRCRG